MAVAILALPALPLWVEIGNWILGTHGIVDLPAVAKQVFLAQLLPLALGLAIVTEVINLHAIIALARPGPAIVSIITTLAAIGMGHVFGGAETAVRHSIAVASALRNVGLALLIAETNKVPPAVQTTIITYAISALILVSVYILIYSRWLKRSGRNIAPC